jgi:hypothetical protein
VNQLHTFLYSNRSNAYTVEELVVELRPDELSESVLAYYRALLELLAHIFYFVHILDRFAPVVAFVLVFGWVVQIVSHELSLLDTGPSTRYARALASTITELIRDTFRTSHVKILEQLPEIDWQEVAIRECESEHTTAIAVDFGLETDDISVDIVDNTATAVVGRDQCEFELPDDDGVIATKNGVLTIEG